MYPLPTQNSGSNPLKSPLVCLDAVYYTHPVGTIPTRAFPAPLTVIVARKYEICHESYVCSSNMMTSMGLGMYVS